jgi:predicted nucleic-acid-binding protein
MRYIDTNVFIRFLTEEKDKISDEFLNFFNDLKRGKIKVKLLDLVFFQIIFVLKSFYKVKKEEIIEVMREILSFKGIYTKNKKMLERTLELWERHSDDIIDCYIVANMELENETELYSFDKKISKLGIKCVSPDSLSQ